MQCNGRQTESTPLQVLLDRHCLIDDPDKLYPALQVNRHDSSVTWGPVQSMKPLAGDNNVGQGSGSQEWPFFRRVYPSLHSQWKLPGTLWQEWSQSPLWKSHSSISNSISNNSLLHMLFVLLIDYMAYTYYR